MQLKLFKDSEVFNKQRPTQLPEYQQDEIYQKLAEEILDNYWSYNDAEDIIYDLKKLSRYDTGEEMLKQLKKYYNLSSYDVEDELNKEDFIEWLDNFYYNFDKELNKNIKSWVNVHNIKPKYEIGTKLIVKNTFSKYNILNKNEIIYINGYVKSLAEYSVSDELDSKHNIFVNYEDIENNCDVI